MSRLVPWTNPDAVEQQDVATLISDAIIDFELYRYTDGISNANPFRKTQPERTLQRLRTVRGRLDRRDRIYQGQKGEVSSSVDHLFIATVYYRNFKIGDVLKYQNISYQVKFVNKVGQSFSEVELEITT